MPVVREIQPAPDPLEAFSRFCCDDHALFLDSSGGPSDLTRHSFLTASPFWVMRSRRGQSTVSPESRSMNLPADEQDPFQVLGSLWREQRQPRIPGLPPFQGGVAGYFAYDLCHDLESLPRPDHDDTPVPDLVVGCYDWVLSWDHRQGRCWIVSTGLPEPEGPSRDRRAQEQADRILAKLERAPASLSIPTADGRESLTAPSFPLELLPGLTSNFDHRGYVAAVKRAIDYIFAGDIFQVNLSQRFTAPLRRHPFTLYRRLRGINPAPFASYLSFGDITLVGASPERFLHLAGDQVETCPIKGTAPRGIGDLEDRAAMNRLVNSLKDRAENVMIVDLLRNDLSRVCVPGSVKVPALCEVQSHPTVHHLVSTVTGTLAPGEDAVTLLKACFPGGSITGAPKIRAMEIIAGLEPSHRGPYCGCVGYLGFEGAMDTNIVIRSFFIRRGRIHFQTGGGVVARSDPEAEYEETILKAHALFSALRDEP